MVGVQNVISEEFVKASVQIIGSRFGNHVDDGAGIAAVFRVKRIGDHFEFLNAIRRRFDRGQICKQVVSIAAVDGVIVGAPAAAIHGDDAGLVRAIKEIVSKLGLHAGLELEQLIDVALVQG